MPANLSGARNARVAASPLPSESSWCRFIAGLVLACLLLTAGLWAQQDLLSDIKVTGNRKIPAETIKARIFTRPGDTYDSAGLERDFNSLWNTGYFEDVRFEREQTPKGWILHVYVKERPVIRDIEYVGISSITTSDILERFKTAKVGLSKESPFDPTKVKKAEVAIKELLSEHGRQFATVRTEVRQIPPAAVGITFAVKEGPKVKVGRIKFVGNKNVNARTLRRAMKNLKPIGIPKSIFLESLFSKTYDASKLNEDTERARLEYQNRGYFFAVVQDPQTQIRDTGTTGFHIPLIMHGPGKAVDITMNIDEGDRYRLGQITFKGNKAVTNTKALRNIFPIRDGDIFSRDKISKGLENLREAYGELGYINFTPLPDTKPNEDKKTIDLEVDLDEGKQFSVRRIEFAGNTTTRDKVIRREFLLEEGQVYNQRMVKASILRLNQLGYFEQLKDDDPNVIDRRLNEKEGTVDLTLKVHEKGKNSIGLTGGVSGLSGAFIGLNYSTNNLFGLGESLDLQFAVGNRQKNISLGFTEPYLFDRPLQFGVRVYYSRYNFDQARNYELATGVKLTDFQVQNALNYTQASTGFQVSVSYPLHRSLKRVGISYLLDRSSTQTFSDQTRRLFENLAFRSLSGQNALNGIITSKVIPSFSFSTLDSYYQPHRGHSLYLAAEVTGIGGNVRYIRPIVNYKRFIPVQKGHNALAFNTQASFITGFGGLVAPPFDRSYLGGENDIRGFDIRTITPYAYIPNRVNVPLRNPDGTVVPLDPSNPSRGPYIVPVPVQSLTIPGGDLSLVGNMEYRITIAGPVVIAPFMDFGINPSLRGSQLRISETQLESINSFTYGCPSRDPVTLVCQNQVPLIFSRELPIVSGTNWAPRMSAGLELQVMLPVVNAPFRIYWAYNPLRLNSSSTTPTPITRGMFPNNDAGQFTYENAIATYGSKFLLKEPTRTFRFTVATTF